MFIFSKRKKKLIKNITLNQYYHPRPTTLHLDGHRQHENIEVLDQIREFKALSM